jgi:protein-S-isoprenylcysteine O-methyltransferase Ste14
MKSGRASAWQSPWSLLVRNLFWTLAFPGVFAGYVPWRFFGLRDAILDRPGAMQLAGLTCVAAGATLLAACIVEFARTGRGTLSPVDPPRELVVRGLYRYVRNPMYLSVATIVSGEALLARSAALAAYGAIWFLCVNLFVIGYEEPTLRQRFGATYAEYRRRVGRWIPRRHAYRG